MWVKSNCRRLLLSNEKPYLYQVQALNLNASIQLSFDDKYYHITNYIVMYTCKTS